VFECVRVRVRVRLHLNMGNGVVFGVRAERMFAFVERCSGPALPVIPGRGKVQVFVFDSPSSA